MKKLVLMDLDRTIINEAYQVIDEKIFDVLGEAQESMLIGLNSDTPVMSLKQWRDCLGLSSSAPLVAERGAIIAVAEEKHFVSGARFNAFRDNMAQRIQNVFPESKVIVGDATNIIRTKRYFLNNAQSRIIMINGYRECSFSCYFRATDNFGQLFIDHDWSNAMLQIISNVTLPLHADKPFYDPDYGIFIINAIDTDKAFGSKTLVDKYYPDYKLFMIGDSMSDYLGTIAVHCAVNNAKDAFKERCSFVAKSKYTSGVIECINWIQGV